MYRETSPPCNQGEDVSQRESGPSHRAPGVLQLLPRPAPILLNLNLAQVPGPSHPPHQEVEPVRGPRGCELDVAAEGACHPAGMEAPQTAQHRGDVLMLRGALTVSGVLMRGGALACIRAQRRRCALTRSAELACATVVMHWRAYCVMS